MNHKIVYFDGVCNLCNGVVQFLIKRNPSGDLRFASLQGARGKLVLAQLSEAKAVNSETIILEQNGLFYTKSDAVLRLSKSMGGLWPLAYLLIVVPRFIRDYVYDIVAQNRYRWFGKADTCYLPKPEWKDRFLD